MKRLFICGMAACLLSISAFAQHELHNLYINVELQPNGDAFISETREMTVGSEGTECYIVIGNLNGSEVNGLCVSDETGRNYDNIGLWQINRSRSEKAHKCGIVQKENGYELCWGIGDEGERTYVTSYTVTNLLKSYNEADGFNYMFVARNIRPYPQHVYLTIGCADNTEINDSIANIWAFGYKGSIWFEDGRIHAESEEPFESDYCMIVMAEFNDSIFQPGMSVSEPFENVKQRAFEGSDYGMDFEDGSEEEDWFDIIIGALVGGGMILLGLVGLLAAPVTYFVRWWKYKRGVSWYRDIPFDGNLLTASDVLNKLRLGTANYDKLLSACVIKLINLGALGIESHPNREGKVVPAFVVKKWDGKGDAHILLRKIYTIFELAAGNDSVLEPWELKAYMKDKHNQGTIDSFLNVLHGVRLFNLSKRKEEVRQLMGLKKYLSEFTLLDERGIQETTLWKDYMVYATLFGNAKRVIKEMQKINPEYFKLDNIAGQMAEGMTVPTIYTVFQRGTADAYSAKMLREHPTSSGSGRSWGGGGFSSFGGGGGFSGGGSGGGIR
jgi:uncharacterized membrane protein YgcG